MKQIQFSIYIGPVERKHILASITLVDELYSVRQLRAYIRAAIDGYSPSVIGFDCEAGAAEINVRDASTRKRLRLISELAGSLQSYLDLIRFESGNYERIPTVDGGYALVHKKHFTPAEAAI